MPRPCPCVSAFVLLLARVAVGLEFYSYGPSYDSQLPKQNDVSSPEIHLAVPITFYGESYSSVFVSGDGLLSFLTEIPNFYSIQFPLNYPIIAPLYANVDTTGKGEVYYRETSDPSLLDRANSRIQQFYPRLHSPFNAKSLFIATWIEVGYYPKGVDKVNTFQVVIASDGSESFVELLYRQSGIQWVQGEGQTSGLPDARAQAGFVAADSRFYTLRGSGTDQIKNLDRWSNSDEPGVWLFRVGNIDLMENVEPPQVSGERENVIEDTSCQNGATLCHSNAECVDTEDNFCCVCQKGFYGNGRTCLQDQIPLRVNGKMSMSLNHEPPQDVDVQAYVVTADGRTYTALSRVPSTVGTHAQLVTSTADIIGWLFAKSINNAPNGYQLTGGILNHTAILTFADGQHSATVEQQFLGLDVYDQLKMEARVSGTLPQVPYGFRLNVPDSQTQFQRTSPGVIQSHSSYILTVDDSQEQFPISVEQTITYSEYCPSVKLDALRVKAARIIISYEETENILRFASTNKVSSISESDDPCVVGQISCVNNSYCIPEGSSFRCACNKGFQTLYSEESTGDYGCVDINECQSGSHTCADNALCINEIGSYSCQCRQGFSGNGFSCQPILKDCSVVGCNPGAQCVDSESGPHCHCVPGFVGDGTTCTPNAEAEDCDICSPFAWCNQTQSGSVQCFCLPGYYGDGYDCTKEEETVIRTCVLGVCFCPNGYTMSGDLCVTSHSTDSHTTSTTQASTDVQPDDDFYQHPLPECYSSHCVCPKGYVFSGGEFCTPEMGANHHTHSTKGPSGDTLSCNVINNCHPHAQCIYLVSEDRYTCHCNAGYEGDGLYCSQMEVSCREAEDVCHPYASCVEDEDTDRAICVCDQGYQGDGTNCYKTDMCIEDQDCADHSTCQWSEDTLRKECLCEPGYVLVYQTCVKQGCEECHEDAECVVSPATGLPQCVCRSGFTGDGVDECIAQPLGCNVLNNCAREAECIYVSPEAGYRCRCSEGYEGNGVECQRLSNCHNDPSLCSSNARCVAISAGYECQCLTGYVGNGVTCTEVQKLEGGFLLVNKGMGTVKIPQETSRSNPGRLIQFRIDQTTIGLDIDCVEGLVYWSDITYHVIKRSNLNGKNITVFIDKDISSPEGLAVDWINRKLYWTDSEMDTIKSANLETRETETIISSGLVNPRGIAVHPTRRKIYWSDWNRDEPKLESANLDGSGRRVLVSQNIKVPNSIAIDWSTDELCWNDAGTKKIECISLESGSRRTVFSECRYPFGLAITADKYYWTDWETEKIESMYKYSTASSDSRAVPIIGGVLYEIAAIPQSCPRV